MKSNSFLPAGQIIRKLRKDRNLPLRRVAAHLDIDTSFLSKIERCSRTPTKDQIIKLSGFFSVEERILMVPYLSEIITKTLDGEECALETLKVVSKKVKQSRTQK